MAKNGRKLECSSVCDRSYSNAKEDTEDNSCLVGDKDLKRLK